MNNTTAAGSADGPKASTASGSPMLPEFRNIIGGTSVRGSMRSGRLAAQAMRPEPSTMTEPAAARSR